MLKLISSLGGFFTSVVAEKRGSRSDNHRRLTPTMRKLIACLLQDIVVLNTDS